MASSVSQKQFTGWHMLAWIISFFSVIIAVNLTMAYLANSTWSGLIVKNGYVASQSFDRDLARARAQDAMGWTVGFRHDEGGIRVTFADADGRAMDGLTIAGRLERPATEAQDQRLTFAATGEAGTYAAPASLAPGVWEVEIEASGGGRPAYRKIFRFVVKG